MHGHNQTVLRNQVSYNQPLVSESFLQQRPTHNSTLDESRMQIDFSSLDTTTTSKVLSIENNTNVSYDRVVQLYDQSNSLPNFAVRLMTDYFTEDELTDNVS